MLTDCLLYFFCSCRRTTLRASICCFFFSSYSSACSFSLACCFFSMSARRFCAVDDELCERVPSRAPNNFWPRLRSSTCSLFRRDGVPASCLLWLASALSRGLLLPPSEIEDCLRFAGPCGEGNWDTGSGRITSEATALQ